MHPEQKGLVMTHVIDHKGRAVNTGSGFIFEDIGRVRITRGIREAVDQMAATGSIERHLNIFEEMRIHGVGSYYFYVPEAVSSVDHTKVAVSEYVMDTLVAAYKRLGHLERKYRDMLEADGEL